MSRLLAQPEFGDWLAAFLPGIADGGPARCLLPRWSLTQATGRSRICTA